MLPNRPPTLRLTLLGLLFVSVVIAVVTYTEQFFVPIFLGLLTWGKAWLKSLTPKLGLILLKNGVVIQLRRLLVQASTHLFVKSHRPWRRWITNTRLSILGMLKSWFDRYMRYPLWVRTAIALILLLTTAGSSLAVFALLIIPQPVLNWLRRQVMSMLNKLGVTQFFSAIWRFLIPEHLRLRWHMYIKWTLGRRQVHAARLLHNKVQSKPASSTEDKARAER